MTQKELIIERLQQNGKISRNECLREYISRLGAHIDRLKKDGWEFEAKYVKTVSKYGWIGQDYVYYVIKEGEA